MVGGGQRWGSVWGHLHTPFQSLLLLFLLTLRGLGQSFLLRWLEGQNILESANGCFWEAIQTRFFIPVSYLQDPPTMWSAG